VAQLADGLSGRGGGGGQDQRQRRDGSDLAAFAPKRLTRRGGSSIL
jgi:hypothetical protein